MQYRDTFFSLASFFALAILAISWMNSTVVAAQTKTFRVRADGGSRVTFVSDAPLETINGVSSNVTGRVRFDPARLSGARGSFQVPVASLRTGIDLRDEHLRSASWLDAASHPNARFEVTRLEGPDTLVANEEARLKIHGRFTLHGVTQNVVAQARVKWIPITDELRQTRGITSDVLRVRVRFKVRLSDFGVTIPAAVKAKVSNELKITVNLRAAAE